MWAKTTSEGELARMASQARGESGGVRLGTRSVTEIDAFRTGTLGSSGLWFGASAVQL